VALNDGIHCGSITLFTTSALSSCAAAGGGVTAATQERNRQPGTGDRCRLGVLPILRRGIESKMIVWFSLHFEPSSIDEI
jgi:hypothetical protein